MSQEDIELVQHIDMVESLAMKMRSQPGYGYAIGDSRHIQ